MTEKADAEENLEDVMEVRNCALRRLSVASFLNIHILVTYDVRDYNIILKWRLFHRMSEQSVRR